MKRNVLWNKMVENDLVAIKDQNEKVHIVWIDRKSQEKRICRSQMITQGTGGKDEEEWEILGNCANFNDYEQEVSSRGREYCKHCSNWRPKI